METILNVNSLSVPQRIEVLDKAIKIITRSRLGEGMCCAIRLGMSLDHPNLVYSTFKLFPELLKYKPIDVEAEHYWWDISEKSSRISVLESMKAKYVKQQNKT